MILLLFLGSSWQTTTRLLDEDSIHIEEMPSNGLNEERHKHRNPHRVAVVYGQDRQHLLHLEGNHEVQEQVAVR